MAPQLVIDNSVVMAWCFNDFVDGYADAVLGMLIKCTAAMPAIWPLEVGNALLVAERRGRVSESDIVRFLTMLRNLPIVVEQESPQRMFQEIFALSRAHRLSTYDASYLDLAMRLGVQLATMDSVLKNAAIQCGVPIFV